MEVNKAKVGIDDEKQLLIIQDTRKFAPEEPIKIPLDILKELLRKHKIKIK